MSYHDTLPLYSQFAKGTDPLLEGDQESGYRLTDPGFHVAYDVALAMGWKEPELGVDHRRTMASLHDFLEEVAANIRAAQMALPCADGGAGVRFSPERRAGWQFGTKGRFSGRW